MPYWRRVANRLPEKACSHASFSSGRAALNNTQRGCPPMAAMSEILVARILWAMASGGSVGKKWRLASSISLLKQRSNPARGRMMAASSPMPSSRSGSDGWGRARWRRIKSNSPRGAVGIFRLPFLGWVGWFQAAFEAGQPARWLGMERFALYVAPNAQAA